jgi:hypothetical protein
MSEVRTTHPTGFDWACVQHVTPEDRRYQQGPGVAAALLMDAGIPVLAQRD